MIARSVFLSQLKLNKVFTIHLITTKHIELIKIIMSLEICGSWEVFLKKIDSRQSEIITEIPQNNSYNSSYFNRYFLEMLSNFKYYFGFVSEEILDAGLFVL